MENNYKEVFFDKLHDLSALYNKVKKAIILAESFDPEHRLYIAPINELRSALDHIFKAVICGPSSSEKDFGYELQEAREHMIRAGYDALELFAIQVFNSIKQIYKDYKRNALVGAFPEYYSVFSPQLTDIDLAIANLRFEKKNSTEESFNEYLEQINKALEIRKAMLTKVTAVEEFKMFILKENRKQTLLAVGIGASGIAASGLFYWLSKR